MQLSLRASILLFLVSLSAMADEPEQGLGAGTWWINLAGGASTVVGYQEKSDNDANDVSGNSPMVAASFNYAVFDHQFVELRVTNSFSYNTDGVNFGSCLFCTPHEQQLDSIFDAGVLYGLMAKSKYLTIAGSIGLAYTAVQYDEKTVIEENNIYDTYESNSTVSTLGVPVELSVFFTPSRYFGLGFMIMANGNSEASYVGGLLGLQFGKLR